MEVNKELENQLKQQIKQYKAAIEVFESLAAQAALLKKITVSSKQAAIMLGVKPRTIRKYHEQNKLVGLRYTRVGTLYFTVEQVQDFKQKYLKNWDKMD